MARKARRLATVAAAVLAAAPAAGCRAPEPAARVATHDTGRRVALVGWDGADWEIAGPLLEAGRMPNLARLRERGAWGEVATLTPTLSPLLWTSVATGRPPEVHGVLDFLEPDPGGGPPRPVGASARSAPALWEMAAAGGRSVGVVAWWATHPAPELPGFLLSDRLAYSLFQEGDEAPAAGGAVYPPEAEAAVLARRLLPAELPIEILRRLRDDGGAPEAEAALRRTAAAALSYHRALLERLQGGQPDLLLVYRQGIDQVSHRFMDCAPPPLRSCPASEAAFAATVERYYEWEDQLLGELLAMLDDRTTVLLVSDHGFLSGDRRPPYVPPDVTGQPGRWHRSRGLFVLAGPDVPAGERPPLHLLDVAPTVLALLGLPVGDDMEGELPQGLLGDEFLARFPPLRIPTWEGAAPTEGAPETGGAPQVDERMRRELEALGYLSAAGSRAAGARTVAAEVNLASRLLQTERYDEASAALRRALDRSSDYAPAWVGLAEVATRRGDLATAASHLARAISLAGGADADGSWFLRWALAMRGGAGDEVDAWLDAALAARPRSADLLAARGVRRAGAGDLEEAERRFRAALALAPAHQEALAGLYAVASARGAAEELEPLLRAALAAGPTSVMPHNWLALILERRGDEEGALALLRQAVARAPGHAGSRVNLGGLLGRMGRHDEAAAEFRAALARAPDDLPARVGLAAALAGAGELQQALSALQAAAPGQRQDPRLLNTLALVYRDLGQRGPAVEALRASLRAQPDQPQVRGLLRELEGSP